MNRTRIAVFGAGSWGTALAIQLSRNPNNEVVMWGHEAEHVSNLTRQKENSEFLPGVKLPDNLLLTSDIAAAAQGIHFALIVVPSYAFNEFLDRLKIELSSDVAIFWATKGFDLASGQLLHTMVEDKFPKHPYGIISGPTFATEVAQNLPTAITCAGNDEELTRQFAECLHYDHFRCYTSDDVIGVEVGGALKNILAIAVGAIDGLGLGANTRSALMTRGLSEMMRFGLQAGGKQETFMGLAGLGDMILTCTDDQSRNRRFGLAIGRGADRAQAEKDIGQTVEGVRAARAIADIIKKQNLDLPIMQKVCEVLFEGKNPMMAISELENRSLKSEIALP